MELQTGTVVDRYAVEGLLGQGGMAIVYRVRHQQLGTLHALKVLMLPAKSIRERLLQEGRVQARLRHANIVSVTDVVDVDGAPGLVMEYIPGPSLDDLLRQHDLSVEQADLIGRGVLEGVAAAHEVGLVHRDLKPGNVLLEVKKDRLIPKITDFGLAKILTDDEAGGSKTRSGLAMGTPCYMAPEQIRNAKGVDERADVFSLGAVLYELVTGRRAFDGDDTFEIFSAVTSGEYTPVRDLVPNAPDRMVEAIRKAMATDREERIQSVEELARYWADGTAPPTAASAFAPAFIQRAEELGSGADEMPLSWAPSTQPATKDQHGVSRGPGGATMDWSLGDDEGGPDAPSIAPALTPQPVTASNRDPNPRRRTAVLLGAAMTVAFAGLLSVGVIGGGVFLVRSDAPMDLEGAPAAAAPAELAPPAEIVEAEPEPAPEPAAAPSPAPAPKAAPTPAPATPTEEAPAPAEEPEAEPEPEPEAVEEPEPTEEGEAEEPVAEEVPRGRVELKTAMHPMAKGASVIATIWLVNDGGKYELPALVPAGDYRIEASFNKKMPVDAGKLTVHPESTVTLNCYSTQKTCKL